MEHVCLSSSRIYVSNSGDTRQLRNNRQHGPRTRAGTKTAMETIIECIEGFESQLVLCTSISQKNTQQLTYLRSTSGGSTAPAAPRRVELAGKVMVVLARSPGCPSRGEKERPHLARATPATSPRNSTRVLVPWESCQQGLETPATVTEPARADSRVDRWIDIILRRSVLTSFAAQSPRPSCFE